MSEDTSTGAAASESASAEAKYTEEQLQSTIRGRVASERKKLEARDAELADMRTKLSELEEMRERLAAAEEERELAGKTAAEKAEAKALREIEKARKEADTYKQTAAQREQELTAAQQLIRTERVARAMSDAMAANKVLYPDKAVRLAMVDIEQTHEEDGTVRASYGDIHDGTIAEAVAAWAKDNPMFLPAPQGGAGTRGGGSMSSTPLHELSAAELMKRARR